MATPEKPHPKNACSGHLAGEAVDEEVQTQEGEEVMTCCVDWRWVGVLMRRSFREPRLTRTLKAIWDPPPDCPLDIIWGERPRPPRGEEVTPVHSAVKFPKPVKETPDD